jgi:glutamate synthase-like protein
MVQSPLETSAHWVTPSASSSKHRLNRNLPDNAVIGFALGCDMINVAREAMLAIGCIQAQKCHADTCPTGVATQNAWLARRLVPQVKAERVANYIKTLRRDLVKVAEAWPEQAVAFDATRHSPPGVAGTVVRDTPSGRDAHGSPGPVSHS